MKASPKHSPPGGRVATLAERDVAALAGRGLERTYARGTVVVYEGDTTDALYIILAGRVKVFVADREGHELVLGEMGAGEYFGEIGFIAPGNKRTLSFECLEDGELLAISYSQVKQLHYQNPKFGFYFLQLISQRLFQDIELLKEKISKTALSSSPFEAAR